MPRPAEQTARRLLTALLAAAALLGTLLVATATPAQALHQNCSGYPAGTFDSGHPDTKKDRVGWSGTATTQALETTLISLGVVKDIADALGEGFVSAAEAQKIVRKKFYDQGNPVSLVAATVITVTITIFYIIAQIAYIAELVVMAVQTALSSALLAVQFKVDDADACGSTLQGDVLNDLWILYVQRQLGRTGPPPALLLAPHDSGLHDSKRPWPLLPQHESDDFAWCPKTAPLPELPPASDGATPDDSAVTSSKDDCTSSLQLGMLDAPTIGVQAVVTGTVEHAAAHGLPAEGARALVAEADALLAAGEYKRAYAHYRSAYQGVMRLEP